MSLFAAPAKAQTEKNLNAMAEDEAASAAPAQPAAPVVEAGPEVEAEPEAPVAEEAETETPVVWQMPDVTDPLVMARTIVAVTAPDSEFKDEHLEIVPLMTQAWRIDEAQFRSGTPVEMVQSMQAMKLQLDVTPAKIINRTRYMQHCFERLAAVDAAIANPTTTEDKALVERVATFAERIQMHQEGVLDFNEIELKNGGSELTPGDRAQRGVDLYRAALRQEVELPADDRRLLASHLVHLRLLPDTWALADLKQMVKDALDYRTPVGMQAMDADRLDKAVDRATSNSMVRNNCINAIPELTGDSKANFEAGLERIILRQEIKATAESTLASGMDELHRQAGVEASVAAAEQATKEAEAKQPYSGENAATPGYRLRKPEPTWRLSKALGEFAFCDEIDQILRQNGVKPQPVITSPLAEDKKGTDLAKLTGYYLPQFAVDLVDGMKQNDKGTQLSVGRSTLSMENGNIKVKRGSEESLRVLVANAKARNWGSIEITSGSDKFRLKLWQEAMRQGIAVKGYQPSEKAVREMALEIDAARAKDVQRILADPNRPEEQRKKIGGDLKAHPEVAVFLESKVPDLLKGFTATPVKPVLPVKPAQPGGEKAAAAEAETPSPTP